MTWHPHNSPLHAKNFAQDAALILHKPKIGFTLTVGEFVSIFSKRGPLNVHAAPKFFDFFGRILIFVNFWGMTCLVSDIRHNSWQQTVSVFVPDFNEWQQTVSVFVPDFNDILHKNNGKRRQLAGILMLKFLCRMSVAEAAKWSVWAACCWSLPSWWF